MSAPIIWIGLPAITAVILWFLRRDERRSLFVGLATSFFFILTSALIQVGKPLVQISTWTFQISPTITILGRSFTLGNGDLVYTTLLFIILFIFLSMSLVNDIPLKFVPISFLLVSLLIAALSVQPFLYAALLLEGCVILSVIMLSENGVSPSIGVIRFLIFQTLAMPFMLASGWVLSAVEANPTETKLIIQALILLGLGFSFWLGVFPFNSWMPQVAEAKSPFLVAFVLILFNTATLILVIRYLDGFVWLRDDARIFTVLKSMGILMIVTSSIMFLFESKLKRTIAHLITFETGMALISMGLNSTIGWNAFVLMFFPRILATSMWALAMTYLHQHELTQSEDGKIHSIILTCLAGAVLTVAGIPALPGFSTRVAIYSLLSSDSLNVSIWIASANLIFIAGCLRFIYRILKTYNFSVRAVISRLELAYFSIFTAILIFTGLAPQVVFAGILNMLQAFPNIK